MIKFLGIFLFGLLLGNCSENSTRNNREIETLNDSTKLLCYQWLNIEEQSGFIASKEDFIRVHSDLDSLLNLITLNLKNINDSTLNRPTAVLSIIGSSIHSFGISPNKISLNSLDSNMDNKRSFYTALKERMFDCDHFVTIYLSIAEKLNLPIYAQLSPVHTFIKWEEGERSVYWETKENKAKTKEDFVKSASYISNYLGISNSDLCNGLDTAIFLKNLTKQQFLSIYYNYAGKINFKNKNIEKSIEDYGEAIKLFPDHFGYYVQQAEYYNIKREYSKALECYNKLVQKYPKYYYFYHLRGLCYETKLKEIGKAVSDFNSSILLYPNYSESYAERGIIEAFYLKQIKNAIEDLNQAIKYNPLNSKYHMNLGIIYESSGDANNAIKSYSEAIQIDSTNLYYIGARGYLYYKKNLYKNAYADFNKALQIDPTDTIAQKYLELTKLAMEHN